MIDWKKYFDHIYCIHYKPHVERFEELNNELKRVGILDSKIFEYFYTEKDDNEYKNQAYKVTINHKKCLEDAYKKMYANILILENDIRFLKDIDYIEKILEQKPSDADLILYDYIFGYELKEIDRLIDLKNNIGKEDYYINFDKLPRIFSAACYMCSRRMQKHLIDNYNIWKPTPDYFTCYSKYSIDKKIDNVLKRYIPVKNISVQKVFDNNLRIIVHGKDNTYERYKYQGINLEDYNI